MGELEMGTLCTLPSLGVEGRVIILNPQTLLEQLKFRGQAGWAIFS